MKIPSLLGFPVLFGAGALLGVCALTASALARSPWWDEAQIQVRVHEHAFHRVTANAVGCSVRVRLYFDAPASEYGEGASERNHYRFLARVSLDADSAFSSPVFDNGEVGARVFAFSYDTSAEGCWAEREHALRKVDVHACRGERCIPKPFE
jgi:hypothetical protein